MPEPKLARWLCTALITSAALACPNESIAADQYAESFLHLKPETKDLSAFVLDLHQEDESYTARFVETLPVTGLRMIIRTDLQGGLSRQWLAEKAGQDYATVYVGLAVEVMPTDTAHDGVLSTALGCRVEVSSEAYSVSTPGFLCRTEYDAGDDGEFFIEPKFGESGVASAFDVHFSVESQKTSDNQGTPDGLVFVGALLSGMQFSLDQSVTDFRQFYRNARPLLRLKDRGTPLRLRFSSYPEPND